jgi:hypothetical protein
MAEYIIRLDDACPTMSVEKWSRVEDLLDKYSVKPIVAVIPHNEDPNMLKDAEDIRFWDKVRSWQEKGWTIALHGYNHVYGTDEAGLVPFNKRSEFSGLPYEAQAKKIKDGINIFKEQGIDAEIWVAPSHSFDLNTLQALRKNSSISVVSDGVAIFPFEKFGFRWIPQQFWSFRKMPIGVWTSCFHPNEMSEKEFSRLESFLEKNHKNFTQIKNLKFKKFCILNNIFSLIYWQLRKMKEIMK